MREIISKIILFSKIRNLQKKNRQKSFRSFRFFFEISQNHSETISQFF